MEQLSVRLIAAQLVLASLVSLDAAERRTVTMEVLTVREVEVCPRGYGHPDGCGDVDVLGNLAGLREANYSEKYELNLRPQDGNVEQHAADPMELELNPGMMRAVSMRLGGRRLRSASLGYSSSMWTEATGLFSFGGTEVEGRTVVV